MTRHRIKKLEEAVKPDDDVGFICVYRDNGIYWREFPGKRDKLFITEQEYEELKRDNTIMLVLFDGIRSAS